MTHLRNKERWNKERQLGYSFQQPPPVFLTLPERLGAYEKKQHEHTRRCRTHTSIKSRQRDRKTRVWLKGVPLAWNSLVMRHEGVGRWVSLSLWLAGEEQGEAWCAGWGLQTGGQSGGEVRIRRFWEYGVFGYDCSCWHVISGAAVTQRGTGAKVNHPALWKDPHQALQLREWTQRIMWETQRRFSFLLGQKNIGESKWIQKKKAQKAAPARFELSQITATSPHQRGRSRKKQTAVQAVDTI